jgi:hypothetical protein
LSSPTHRKVVFTLEQDEDGYPPVAYESAWVADLGDGRFLIDSIPFFAREATLGDTIAAADDNGELRYSGTIERSKNSLFRVVYFDGTDPSEIRRVLSSLGCSTELNDVHRLIAVNVPREVRLEDVRAYLETGFSSGRWDYEEAILRHA